MCARHRHGVELPPEERDIVELGGLLHDIGKIGVPEAVLRKPGALEPEEFAEIRKHPGGGAAIVEKLPEIARLVNIGLYRGRRPPPPRALRRRGVPRRDRGRRHPPRGADPGGGGHLRRHRVEPAVPGRRAGRCRLQGAPRGLGQAVRPGRGRRVPRGARARARAEPVERRRPVPPWPAAGRRMAAGGRCARTGSSGSALASSSRSRHSRLSRGSTSSRRSRPRSWRSRRTGPGSTSPRQRAESFAGLG